MANDYIAEVFEKLQSNPTAQELDFLIEAHTRIGYLVSVARGRAELADSVAKYERSSAFARARASGEAKSAADAEHIALIASHSVDRESIKAREAYSKLTNLLNSVEQSINGVKFLGRSEGGMVIPSDRRA